MSYPPAKTEVSLFPFLSVLCAMIGVMMLLLVGVLSSRVMESEAARQFVADEDGAAGTDPSAPQPIRLVPDPAFQITRQPKLVEVAAGRLVVHPEKREYPLADLASEDPRLAAIFNDLNAARQSEYLLLLVHPGGIEEYYALRAYLARKRYRFEIGVEPFVENWMLAPRDGDDSPLEPSVENEL